MYEDGAGQINGGMDEDGTTDGRKEVDEHSSMNIRPRAGRDGRSGSSGSRSIVVVVVVDDGAGWLAGGQAVWLRGGEGEGGREGGKGARAREGEAEKALREWTNERKARGKGR